MVLVAVAGVRGLVQGQMGGPLGFTGEAAELQVISALLEAMARKASSLLLIPPPARRPSVPMPPAGSSF